MNLENVCVFLYGQEDIRYGCYSFLGRFTSYESIRVLANLYDFVRIHLDFFLTIPAKLSNLYIPTNSRDVLRTKKVLSYEKVYCIS